MPFPVLYTAEVEIAEPGDTYFDMQHYKKGYLYVNDWLLGRYWNVGPQQRLFCPGVWLKKGVNRVTVLELLESGEQAIAGMGSLKG
jgi:beta-galactosidase